MSGQQVTANMEFFPLDLVIPAGHALELVLQNTGRQYLPSAVSKPVLVDLDQTSFRLPLIKCGPGDCFQVVEWDEDEVDW